MAKGKYAAETAAVIQRMKEGARLSFNTYTKTVTLDCKIILQC